MPAMARTALDEVPGDGIAVSVALVAELVPAGVRVLHRDGLAGLTHALAARGCTIGAVADDGRDFDAVVLSIGSAVTADDVLSGSRSLMPGGLLVTVASAPPEAAPSPAGLACVLESAGLTIEDVRTATTSLEHAVVIAARAPAPGPVTVKRPAVLRRERDEARDELRATQLTLAQLESAYDALLEQAASAGRREERLRVAAQDASGALLERDRRLLALERELADALSARAGLAAELTSRIRDLESRLRHATTRIDDMRSTRAWRAAGAWWRLRRRVIGR